MSKTFRTDADLADDFARSISSRRRRSKVSRQARKFSHQIEMMIDAGELFVPEVEPTIMDRRWG